VSWRSSLYAYSSYTPYYKLSKYSIYDDVMINSLLLEIISGADKLKSKGVKRKASEDVSDGSDIESQDGISEAAGSLKKKVKNQKVEKVKVVEGAKNQKKKGKYEAAVASTSEWTVVSSPKEYKSSLKPQNVKETKKETKKEAKNKAFEKLG